MAKKRKSFSESLAGVKQKKNHPQSRIAKADIRQRVLEHIGVDKADVLEAFCGRGEMFRLVWNQARSYVGCDIEWARDERLAYVVDNRRLLRHLDLHTFNVFDLDAHGSPWEQAWILSARRQVQPGETLGVILTEGSGLQLKTGGISHGLALLSGVKGKASGVARWQDDLLDRAIGGMCKRMRCKLVKRWQATRKQGAAMRYVGLVLVGQSDESDESESEPKQLPPPQ